MSKAIQKTRPLLAGLTLLAVLFLLPLAGCGTKQPDSGELGKQEEQKEQEKQEEQKEQKEQNSLEEANEKDKADTSDTSDTVDTEEKNEQAPTDTEEENEEASKAILTNFEALTLDGETITQDALADYDMTIINFWATTCGPCIAEMPELAALSEELPDRIQVMTVCLDGSGQEEVVAELLEEAGFTGTTLLPGTTPLSRGDDFEALCYAVMYTPTTVFIDSEGNLAGKVIIGGQREFRTVYGDILNQALQESGKEEVVLDEE